LGNPDQRIREFGEPWMEQVHCRCKCSPLVLLIAINTPDFPITLVPDKAYNIA
jgi:hypothetical protein